MITQQLTISNRLGLHTRAAMKLMDKASRYQSEIIIKHKDQRVNAKSIMGLLVLALSYGTTFEVEITGPDETEAAKAIETLLKERFGENE